MSTKDIGSHKTMPKSKRSSPSTTSQKQGLITVARHFERLDEPYKVADIPDYLAGIDHSMAIDDKAEYEKALRKEEEQLNLLVRQMSDQNRALAVVLQGRDGAGKTGATKRIAEALGDDYKIFASVPISAPTVEELKHGFLWRFKTYERWPSFGQLRVFDRSWAERVLVERVMKITPPAAIEDSYAIIRLFEKLWIEQGIIIVKIWLDISKGEQKKRFEDRKKDAPWKISESDAIARAHWDGYTPAANELFHRTGTDFAPWHVVSSEDKRYSRVTVLRIVNQALRQNLEDKSSDSSKGSKKRKD